MVGIMSPRSPLTLRPLKDRDAHGTQLYPVHYSTDLRQLPRLHLLASAQGEGRREELHLVSLKPPDDDEWSFPCRRVAQEAVLRRACTNHPL